MKAEKFRVISSFKNVRRSQIWDSSKPMAIDREFTWILEKGDKNPQVRHIATEPNQIKTGSVYPIDLSPDDKKSICKIQDGVSIEIQRLRSIRPAYVATGSKATVNPSQALVVAFSGSGRSLFESSIVHSAYIAFSRKKPIFSLQSSSEGYHIRPLLPGVQLKLKNQKPTLGKTGEAWKLNAEELAHCTILRSSRWWRFNLLNAKEAAFDTKSFNIAPQQEGSAFRKSLIIFGILFLSLCGVVIFTPHKAPMIKEEEPEAPIVKFIAPQAKLVEPPKPPTPLPEVKKEEPPAPVEPPKPVEKPKVEPKPPAAKQEMKSPPPKKAPPVQTLTPPVHTGPKKVESAAASRLAALKNAFGGAMLLSKKAVGKISDGTKTAVGLFTSTDTSVKSIDLKPGYSGSNVKVQQIGGSNNGTGYGSSQAPVGTSGGAKFVEFDQSALTVEKGLLPEEVGAAIHKHMEEIRYCHEAAMVYKPDVSGKVIVQFSINPSGAVEKMAIQTSTVSDKNLENCILKHLVKWQFPKPKGGIHVAVTYPFLFKVLDRE